MLLFQGHAIGLCPKEKLFRSYIDLELQLREFDRCRVLYGKFLEYMPENSSTWIKFAELETLLGDLDRARAIFNLAIQQPALDMPEVCKNFFDLQGVILLPLFATLKFFHKHFRDQFSEKLLNFIGFCSFSNTS